MWLGGNKLVVWDFDLTLLKIHSFAEGVEPSDVAARWKRDVADIDLLQTFVERSRELGVALSIASFGRAEVIMAHIAPGVFRPEHIPSTVVTPSNLNLRRRGWDGRAQREGDDAGDAAASTSQGPVAPSVLFFDDDAANVHNCLRANFSTL